MSGIACQFLLREKRQQCGAGGAAGAAFCGAAMCRMNFLLEALSLLRFSGYNRLVLELMFVCRFTTLRSPARIMCGQRCRRRQTSTGKICQGTSSSSSQVHLSHSAHYCESSGILYMLAMGSWQACRSYERLQRFSTYSQFITH